MHSRIHLNYLLMTLDRCYPFALLPLDYAEESFDPTFLSKETFQFHRGKHHLGYINKLNALLENSYKEFQTSTLTGIVLKSKETNAEDLFNNAGQTLNHDLYWKSISPDKQTGEGTKLLENINLQYGSWENFVEFFVEKSMKRFGSGWSWLHLKDGGLEIITTGNADSPLDYGIPILTCDLWEHAYYINFRNDRAIYIKRMLNEFLNWRGLEEAYLACKGA
jgi:superoxide dismutase, Fe-Mn family